MFNIKLQHAARSFLIASSITVLTLLFSNLGISSLRDQEEKENRIEALSRFTKFQAGAQAAINESINLLYGYLAYIELHSDLTEEASNRYLEHLLSEKETLIRNVGIIEDTTIIWNYPKETNQKAIGVDLAKIPEQSEDILKVKEKKTGLFIGPINLVQGGLGFIARIPIIKNDEYYGQISIVLDGEEYLEYLNVLSSDSMLNMAFYNFDSFKETPFYGDAEILEREHLTIDFNLYTKTIRAVFEPIDGFDTINRKILVYRILASLVCLLFGYFIFTIMHTRYRLHFRSSHDPLTGLYNRYTLENQFNQMLKQTIANKEEILVVLLDINKFKQINDTYGHKVGDLVLIDFSNKLKQIDHPSKKIFRLGGDEFFIIFSNDNNSNIPDNILSDIRLKTHYIFEYGDISIEVISSIGIAKCPKDGILLDTLMHQADLMMYKEKQKSRQS